MVGKKADYKQKENKSMDSAVISQVSLTSCYIVLLNDFQ